jgi:uncharacterized protein
MTLINWGLIKTYKILVAGPFSSGKSTFIETISELGREKYVEVGQGFDNEKTVWGIEFGKIPADGELFFLFSPSGARRYDFMWEMVADYFLGFVMLVDSSRPETFREAKSLLETFSAYAPVSYVIAANKQDIPNAWDIDGLRKFMRVSDEIPMIPCNARDKKSVANVLITLCQEILKRIEAES